MQQCQHWKGSPSGVQPTPRWVARSFWHFDSTLEKELKNAAPQSVAIMNVKPILAVEEENERSVTTVMMGMEGRLCSFGKCQVNVRAPGHEIKVTTHGSSWWTDMGMIWVKFDNNNTLQLINTNHMMFQMDWSALPR
jgi:hypothetical protein